MAWLIFETEQQAISAEARIAGSMGLPAATGGTLRWRLPREIGLGEDTGKSGLPKPRVAHMGDVTGCTEAEHDPAWWPASRSE